MSIGDGRQATGRDELRRVVRPMGVLVLIGLAVVLACAVSLHWPRFWSSRRPMPFTEAALSAWLAAATELHLTATLYSFDSQPDLDLYPRVWTADVEAIRAAASAFALTDGRVRYVRPGERDYTVLPEVRFVRDGDARTFRLRRPLLDEGFLLADGAAWSLHVEPSLGEWLIRRTEQEAARERGGPVPSDPLGGLFAGLTPKDAEDPMRRALRTNRAPDALALINSGWDLGQRDGEGRSALHLAAYAPDDPTVLLALIEAGAEVDARDAVGRTPLHYAVGEDDAKARLLLAAGADPNANSGVWTPLHQAAAEGASSCCRLLVGAGADVDVRTATGRTPAMVAAMTSPPFRWLAEGTLCALTDCGADVSATDAAGWALLHYAATWGDRAGLLHCLAKGAQMDLRNAAGETPLLRALKAARPAMGRLLLERGAAVDAVDGAGRAPLHWTAGWGNVESTRLVLEHEPDVNARDAEERTPLDYALAGGHEDVAAILREHGARTGAEVGGGEARGGS